MWYKSIRTFVMVFLMICTVRAYSQEETPKFQGGLNIGLTIDDAGGSQRKQRFLARPFFRYAIANRLQGDVGIGIGQVAGRFYTTRLIPLDHRFLFSPMTQGRVQPYAYAGLGVLNYNVTSAPVFANASTSGWIGFVPYGLGAKIQLNDKIKLDFNAGHNATFSDNLNAVSVEGKDAYWSILTGLSFTRGPGNPDLDADGLTNDFEKSNGTDPKNADTDGDGLSDGAEVNTHNTDPNNTDTDGDGLSDGAEVNTHNTNPTMTDTDGDGLSDDREINQTQTMANNADSDGDGLSDGAEINTHRTNPTVADSDGDGLSDGAEVNRHRTEPGNPDSDGDGLSDGAEINTHRTNPTVADSDGDGLSDGAEVNQHRTNPTVADSDGGSVDDGTEVNRGSDPNQADDDVTLDVAVGESLVLDGVVFATNSADISPESEQILHEAYNTLAQQPDIEVEIRGYTDNTGNRSYNIGLSQRRADAVKAHLVGLGIAAERITTKGFGPDNPAADNNTEEGRRQNRRIEFFRTK